MQLCPTVHMPPSVNGRLNWSRVHLDTTAHHWNDRSNFLVHLSLFVRVCFSWKKHVHFIPQKIHSRLSKCFMEKMETFLSIEFAEWQRCGLRGIKSETQKNGGFFSPWNYHSTIFKASVCWCYWLFISPVFEGFQTTPKSWSVFKIKAYRVRKGTKCVKRKGGKAACFFHPVSRDLKSWVDAH